MENDDQNAVYSSERIVACLLITRPHLSVLNPKYTSQISSPEQYRITVLCTCRPHMRTELFCTNQLFHKVVKLAQRGVSQQKTKLKRWTNNNKISDTATTRDAHIDKHLSEGVMRQVQLQFRRIQRHFYPSQFLKKNSADSGQR